MEDRCFKLSQLEENKEKIMKRNEEIKEQWKGMLAKVRKGISSCYNCIYRSHWGVVQCCSKLIFYQQCWHPIWTVVCVQAALTSMQLPANNLGRRQKRALNLGLLCPHGASGSWLQSVTFKQLEEGPPRPLNSENRISKSAVTPRVHSQ